MTVVQWHTKALCTMTRLEKVSGSYVTYWLIAVLRTTAELPQRSCGILRAARRKRWHGIIQESDLAFDTMSGEESAASAAIRGWHVHGFPLCNTSAVAGHCQFEGLNSSVARCVAPDSTITGCPLACVAQRVTVTMRYFIDPCREKSFCLLPDTELALLQSSMERAVEIQWFAKGNFSWILHSRPWASDLRFKDRLSRHPHHATWDIGCCVQIIWMKVFFTTKTNRVKETNNVHQSKLHQK